MSDYTVEEVSALVAGIADLRAQLAAANRDIDELAEAYDDRKWAAREAESLLRQCRDAVLKYQQAYGFIIHEEDTTLIAECDAFLGQEAKP